jgi:hypothetical protein
MSRLGAEVVRPWAGQGGYSGRVGLCVWAPAVGLDGTSRIQVIFGKRKELTQSLAKRKEM